MRPSIDALPHVSITSTELGLPGSRVRRFDLIGPLPARPRVAIVGSRAARVATLTLLEPIVGQAATRGWSLVSGGALGIDGGAHRAALALGVAQLAVLPCGRDRPYPPNHVELFARMAASDRAGLLFAQPIATEPSRAMFASRNAIVIGLADAVLVAEAGLRSGSTGTGRLALQRGRPVAAIAGTPGCGALIGAGARALPATPRAGELARAFGAWLDALAGGSTEPPAGPPWPERLAWLAAATAAAGPAGLSIDALADPNAAALAICEAELLGLVGEAAPGRWVRL